MYSYWEENKKTKQNTLDLGMPIWNKYIFIPKDATGYKNAKNLLDDWKTVKTLTGKQGTTVQSPVLTNSDIRD